MLDDAAVQELVDSKSALTDFTTAALVHSLAAAAQRAQDKATPANQLAQLLEAIRKVRADLTGQDHERAMPQMLVNIQLGNAPQAVPIDVTAASPAEHGSASALPGLEGQPVAIEHVPSNLP